MLMGGQPWKASVIMSEISAETSPLDPARPWITDPEDVPGRMRWFSTLFNVMGESSKLHFTRAWTLLFMLQFLFVFGGGLILFILTLTGVETAGLSVGNRYAAALVFMVTTLMSFVIHTRRLAHARRSPLWAVLILLPLLLAGFVTLGNIQKSAAQYDTMYQKRTEFLADPGAYREAALSERRAAQRARAAQTEENAGRQARRGRRDGGDWRGRQPYNAENALPSQEAFILRPHIGQFLNLIMVLSAFLVPWSLIIVARATPRRPRAAMTA